MRSDPSWLSWIEPDGIHLNADGHAWIHREVQNWRALLAWAQLETVSNVSMR